METPDYFYNYDLENIVTPVNIDLLVNLLEELEYDAGEIEFLREGFTNGFDIGYEGPQKRKSTSENIPLTVGTHVELWNKLMKEVKLGQVAGPYKEIPFENLFNPQLDLSLNLGVTRLGSFSICHMTLKETT